MGVAGIDASLMDLGCVHKGIKKMYHHPTVVLSSHQKIRNTDIPLICFYLVHLQMLHETNLDKRTSQSQPPAHPTRAKDGDLLSEAHLLIKELWALFP